MANDNRIIIEMYDEHKRVHNYELLDIEVYEGNEYAVMLEDNSFEKQVEIFKLKHSDDKSATRYFPETDKYIAYQVFQMFREKFEKYHSDSFKFED